MEHDALLRRLGGNEYVAGKLGVHFTSVSRWKRYGIPPLYWHQVVKLAKARRIKVSVEQLARASPVWGDGARASGGELNRRAS